MSRLTRAMEEALASAPRDVELIETIEIDHASMTDPLRLVRNVEDDMFLPLVFGGDPVEHIACAFEVTPPGFGDEGPTPANIGIDNASGLINEKLAAVTGGLSDLTFVYRSYRSDDLTAPGEVIEGMIIREVELTATRASASPALEDISRQAFPRLTYTLTEYPANWTRI